MFLEDCLILENKHIAGQNYLMRLKADALMMFIVIFGYSNSLNHVERLEA